MWTSNRRVQSAEGLQYLLNQFMHQLRFPDVGRDQSAAGGTDFAGELGERALGSRKHDVGSGTGQRQGGRCADSAGGLS
jgi:hypothetical protein